MSVEELIEELKRQPNQHVPVVIISTNYNGHPVKCDVVVRFDGPCVVLEAE